MTWESDRLSELRLLIEALCEESITPEQMVRLEEMIVADPEAKAFYVRYMHLQSDLRRKFGGMLPEGDLIRRLRVAPRRRFHAPWKRRAAAAAGLLLRVGLAAALLPP
jgi:hypothetical protein